MEDQILITELLKENFPVECETVGPTNLEDIVESEVEFVPSQYGSNMDLGTTIQYLLVASTVIKNILDIYAAIKKQTGSDPVEAEITVKLDTHKGGKQKIDEHIQAQLIKSIIKKLRK